MAAQSSSRVSTSRCGEADVHFTEDAWSQSRVRLLRGVAHGFSTARAAHRGYLTRSDPADGNPAEHLYGLKVTQNLFPLLGTNPLLGRFFAALIWRSYR